MRWQNVPRNTNSKTDNEGWLKITVVVAIVLESIRWALQGRYPELRHPAAPGVAEWIRLFYGAQVVTFAGASIATAFNIIDAAKMRSWRSLDLVALALYLAWWVEIALANGH
jgi:hypothetical protein